jgi:hypothetical protein
MAGCRAEVGQGEWQGAEQRQNERGRDGDGGREGGRREEAGFGQSVC